MEEKKTRSPKHAAPKTRAAHTAPGAAREKWRFTRRRKMAAPFFTVLFALALIALIIPLRPTESMREKRRLAEFPKLTAKTLLDGDFFDGVSTGRCSATSRPRIYGILSCKPITRKSVGWWNRSSAGKNSYSDSIFRCLATARTTAAVAFILP